MATAVTCSISIFLLLLAYVTSISPPGSSLCGPKFPAHDIPVDPEDVDLFHFANNLEFLEAEFFLHSALGEGLDKVAPELVMGGPPPIGTKAANLDSVTKQIITEFGYQEVGHLRAIKSTVNGFPRPLMDLSTQTFAAIFDEAFGYHINPPFDVYASDIHYMLGSYLIPYMGLVGYVGANPFLKGYKSKRLLSGLLGIEGGQDAVIRMYLYQRANDQVHPYNHTVSDFTTRLSHLRNKLAKCGNKDEGLIVSENHGADNKTTSNVLSANGNSLSYSRAPSEILRVVYGGKGDEHTPGGFFPNGASGKIAKSFLGKEN